jgi:hypothetical protein
MFVALDGTGGGGRTHTLSRVLDFESSASANSATPALRAGQYRCRRREANNCFTRKIRACGYSFAKIAALRDIAAKTLDGTIPSSRQMAELDDEAIIARLTAARGVGRWTVEMLLIFQLGRADVLPVDDFGVRNGFRLAYRKRGLPKSRALRAFGEKWRPYRTTAAWYLWQAGKRAVRMNRRPVPLLGLMRLPIPVRGSSPPRRSAVAGAAVSSRRRWRPRLSRRSHQNSFVSVEPLLALGIPLVVNAGSG